MEKMTYVVALTAAIETAALTPEVADKLKALRAQLEKKTSPEKKKPTKTQTANQTLEATLYDAMEFDRPYTVTDMMKSIPELADLSNQKISALLRNLKSSGKVKREEFKGKAYFIKLSEETEVEEG